MNPGSRALPCAKLAAPASRNSLTSRSCRVLCARSTRPLAGLVKELRLAGADDVDVERVQSPAKLGHPVTAERPRMVDPEDAVLVAVERHRLAPGLEISPGGVEIGEGRLAFDKLQVHQPARRIVDKHQQRALRPAVFEPPMFAAVDLHQLANALAPMARLVNTPAPLFAVEPQPLGDHPFAQGLA